MEISQRVWKSDFKPLARYRLDHALISYLVLILLSGNPPNQAE